MPYSIAMGRNAVAVAAVAAALVAAPAARADAYYGELVAPPPPPTDEFWREVVEPHGDEIVLVLQKARQAYQQAQGLIGTEHDATGEQRARLLDDAYHMLRYARRLDPTRTDVLRLLGEVAEEAGRATAAVEVYQGYLGELEPDEIVGADVHTRLGRAYMRLGRWDDAIRHLRAALPPETGGYYQGVVGSPSPVAFLALALMTTDRLAEAVDLLEPRVTANLQPYGESLQAAFTLAVAYDRDEQISAAFGVLDTIANQLGGVGHGIGYSSYTPNVLMQLQPVTFVPAYDQHYYLALLYESAGYLAEARLEWMLYAEVEDAPYRQRALAHVAAIDALQAERLDAAAKAARARPAAPRPAARPRPRPHRHPSP